MQPNLPIDKLLDAVRHNANLPDELAEATPPQIYTSPEFLEKELDEIFNHEWVCAGRVDEFAAPGAYRTLTIGRDPVIVLRDREGILRAMSNICRHRMMTLVQGEGTLPGRISCPYHAWTYNHDGRLLGAAHMRANFEKTKCRLPQFKTEVWEGWVYVNLDPDAPPLAPRLAALGERLRNYRVAEYRTLFRVDEVWETNWKILVQNFMEGYHLFAVHTNTVQPALPTKKCEILRGDEGFSLYRQGRNPGVPYEYGAAMESRNTQLSDEETNTVYLFNVFPCQVVSVTPERTFWMSLQPMGVDKVRVFWGVDVFPEFLPEGEDAEIRIAELKKSFRAINDEDKPVVAAIARNARALAAEPGRLSPKENTIWDFQRYLARRLCGEHAVAD